MKLQLSILSALLVLIGLLLALNGNIYGHLILIIGSLLFVGLTSKLNNLKPDQGKSRKRSRNALLIIAMVCTLSATAQSEKPAKVLIVDETYLTVTEKNFKIVTSNEYITKKIESQFFNKLKSLTRTEKTDRKGKYLQTTFNFPLPLQSEIVTYIKNLPPVK